MKKSSIVLGSFMVLALLATGAKAADTFFKDVPTTHWGYAAVNWLKTSGVVVGYTDNTFKGDQNITRYEMASIMSKYNTMLTKDMDAMEKEMMDKMAAMEVKMAEMNDEEAAQKEYSNEKLDFSFMYPGNWKLAEYNNPDLKVFNSVALDPQELVDEEIFWTVDTYAGLITFMHDPDVTQYIGYDKFSTEKIGKDNAITAKKDEIEKYTNSPNPAWEDKHVITYYIHRPDTPAEDDLVIEYVSDQENKNLEDFQNILDTLKIN